MSKKMALTKLQQDNQKNCLYTLKYLKPLYLIRINTQVTGSEKYACVHIFTSNSFRAIVG